MFVFLSLVWFVLGFAAAVVWAARNRVPKDANFPISEMFAIVTDRLKKGAIPLPNEERPLSRRSSDDLGPNAGLYSKKEVEETFDHSSWQRLAYEDFKTKIMASNTGLKTFPCIYATMGYRQNGHMYLFLKSQDISEPQNVRIIGPALTRYLNIARGLGPNTSLVIIAAPPDMSSTTSKSDEEIDRITTVEDYNNKFWELLRGLRIHDPEPWPESIPPTVQDERWTFCYDGQPIFPVLLTPAHSRRYSRQSSVPVIALQPKWILDELLSTPEKRDSATGKVRKLLKEYDTIDPSPDLTGYGEQGSSEVRQLCLRDENTTMSCPYQDFDKR